MTDTATETAPEVEVPAEATKPVKVAKAKVEPHPCACSTYEVGEEYETDGKPDRSIFTTECDATTIRTFAQGHDARLVSFLVSAELDKQKIWRNTGSVLFSFTGAEHAASHVSDALADKAKKAVENQRAKLQVRDDRKAKQAAAKAAKQAAKQAAKDAKAQEKAEKDAAKAPKDVPVTVVEGSQEGEAAPAEKPVDDRPALVRIKIGRWEYEATDNGDGTLTYLNNTGEEQTRNRDEVRVLG